MEKAHFGELISDIYLFFERKLPAKRTVDMWYEELQHIPRMEADNAAMLFKQINSWPFNFVATFKDMWRNGRPLQKKPEDHPRRFRPWDFAAQKCPICAGQGFTKQSALIGKQKIKITANILCKCTDKAEYPF